jgi:3-oxoacyl-[acyl-carrier-protein] synthase-3
MRLQNPRNDRTISIPMKARITGTGSYVPELIVRNEDLTQFPATVLPLIAQKTGVKKRHHAAETQCTSDLAIAAGRRCLEKAGLAARNLDAIILATSSPDRLQPATATRVQQALGADRAFAFDMNSVCSGAVYALHVADSLIRSGSCRQVLVLAAEVYSRFLNPKDFATYPYFGDGAGAILLSAHEGDEGIVRTVLHSDGAGCDVIQIPAGGSMMPLNRLKQPADVYFKMKGKDVFEFAVSKGAAVVGELLAQAGVSAKEIDFVVPHQANVNIVDELAVRTGIDRSRFVVNLDRYGNTAAASIPLALDEFAQSGNVKPGNLGVLVAFGGGLSWAASLIRF